MKSPANFMIRRTLLMMLPRGGKSSSAVKKSRIHRRILFACNWQAD